MSKVKKEALETILKVAEKAISGMDADTQEAFAALQELQNNCEGDTLDLFDRTQYKECILWSDSDATLQGCLDNVTYDQPIELSEEEADDLIERAARDINWQEVEEACCEAGNEVIQDYFAKALYD